MKRLSPSAWALLIVVIASTALRVFVLRAGPDLDTDAYGHAVLGRYTWADPGNLQIHWVWLPLWHFVFGALGALGLGFQVVRGLDVLLSGCIPLLVYATVQCARPELRGRSWVAVLGAAFAAFFPLAITHGQSAEPEAAFCVLLLGAALAIERERRLLASSLLACAVLLRFEAWAVLPAFALASVQRAAPALGWPRRLLRGSLAVWAPGLTILAYVYVHHLAYDGRWLVFLRENHAFVHEARTHAIPGVGPQPSVFWYAAILPFRTAGPVVVFAALGVWRFLRGAPITYRWVGPWLLAFVTLGWVREQHLGLDRHFFAVVPFYAVAMAEGMWLVAERVPRRAALPLAAASVLLLFGFSLHHARGHARASQDAFAPERDMARLLRERAPAPSSVYCSWGKVEVLSGVRQDRFAGADAVRERAALGQPVTVVDDVGHRERWPSDWRIVGETSEIVVLAGP